MSDLVAKIRIGILDSFTGPLKHLGVELQGVKGKLNAIGASGDLSGKVDRSTAAVSKFGAAAKPALDRTSRALGATGTATDAVRARMEAFTKVAELQKAVTGARAFERESRAAMGASGAGADAAAKHFAAFGKLDALRKQLAEARKFEIGMRKATAVAGASLRGMAAPNKAAGQSFAAMSKQAIAALMATDGKLDQTGAHLRAFEKLAELRRAEEGFRRVARAAGGLGGPIDSASKKASSLRSNLRGIADATIALGGVKTAFDAVARAAAAPIKSFVSLDAARGEVESALPRGTGRESEDFKSLSAQQLEIGKRSAQFSMEDVAMAQADALKSGLKTPAVLQSIPIATDLATAASTPREKVMPDQGMAIISKTAAMFGLDAAKEAQRIADAYVSGADASQSDVTGLYAAVSEQSGSMAAGLGMSPEQLLTDLAMLSNKGQDKTKAGTSWTAMMERFIAPTAPAVEAFAKIGIDGDEVKQFQKLASGGQLPAILERLAAVTRTYSREEVDAAKTKTRESYRSSTDASGKPYSEAFIASKVRQTESDMTGMRPEMVNEAFKHIFETQGSEGVRKLLSNYVVGADGMTEQQRMGAIVAGSPRITQEKAAIKDRTAAGQMGQAKGGFDALMANIGSKFAGEIEWVTSKLSAFFETLSTFMDEFTATGKALTVLGVAAGGLAGTWVTLKGLGAGAAAAGKMLGWGAAAAAPAVPAAGALAGAGAEVAAASAAATEAVAAMGGATAAAGGTAAAVGGGSLAAIAAPIAAALVPITAGVVAQQTGADVKAFDWIVGGGIGDSFAGALKSTGLNETVADTVGKYASVATAGPVAAMSVLPAVGSGLGRAYDWMTGDDKKPTTAPVNAPGDAVPSSVPPLLARVPDKQPEPPLLLGSNAPAVPAGAPGESAESPARSDKATDDAALQLAREQLQATRDQLQLARDAAREGERRHRELRDEMTRRRRSGGPQTGGVLDTF